MRKAFVFLFLLILTGTLTAQPGSIKKSEIKQTINGTVFYIHTIESGQTLYSIAKAYEVTQDDIIKHNPEAAEVLKLGETLKIIDKDAEPVSSGTTINLDEDKYLSHTVNPGESSYSIARQYNITLEKLMSVNPNMDPDNIKVGQKLNIPVNTEPGSNIVVIAEERDTIVKHTVQRRETLYGIAQQYDVNIDSIISWNPILKEKSLKKGQILNIHLKIKSSKKIIEVPTTQYDTILHLIKDKETLWGLATKYKTSVDEILAINPELKDGLKEGYYIYVPVPKSEYKGNLENKPGEGCEHSRFKNKYKVALLMPLYLKDVDKIYINPTEHKDKKPAFKPFTFLEFYEGAMIAVDSMKKAGLSVDLYVYDTENDSNTVKKIMANAEMPYMDMIIGPFFPSNYKVAVRFADEHNIKLVSPFARKTELLGNNNNLFQIGAASETKVKQLADYITTTYNEPSIILVTNGEKDAKIAQAFKEQLDKFTKLNAVELQFFEVNYSIAGFAGVSKMLDANKKNIIVNLITGEAKVTNYVSNMNKMTETFDITMFGMPEWENYRTFDLEYLMALDLHMFSNTYINYEDEAVKQFLKKFMEDYKSQPNMNNYAFMGYDIFMFFLSAMHQQGLDFENCLNKVGYDPLSMDFDWYQHNANGFENRFINIYRYNQEYKLELMNRK